MRFKDKSHREKIAEASFFLGMFKSAAKTTGNDITGNQLSKIDGTKLEVKTPLAGQDISRSDKITMPTTALHRVDKELDTTKKALGNVSTQLLKPAEPVKLNKGTSLAGNLYDKQNKAAAAAAVMFGEM